MKTAVDIKPSLLTPETVALMWSVSIKKIYEFINTGQLPHVLLPTSGKRKRLIRIRAAVAESWVLQHEVGTTPTEPPTSPRHRRRSILQPPKGVAVLKRFKNESESANENSKNS
jgi:Helix-turn-helix domain